MFEQGVAEYGDMDAAVQPCDTLAPEQAVPVVGVPQWQECRVAQCDHDAGFVEVGECALGARALLRAHVGDFGYLACVECALECGMA